MRILVADDDPLMRDLLEAVLVSAGHEVTTVEDGAAAWTRYQAEPYPLLLLEQVLAAGADDYLPKPATPSDVAARLRDAKEHGSVEYARGQRMVDLGDRRGQVP